jgi:hypothetical protein
LFVVSGFTKTTGFLGWAKLKPFSSISKGESSDINLLKASRMSFLM